MKHGLSAHAYGFVITVLGVLILCPDTLLIRLVQAEGGSQWTIAFWRGLLTAAGLMVFYRLAEGRGAMRHFFRVDRWVLAAALTMGIQALAFILSVANTSVANTLIIVATGPLFTALFAWGFLNERPPLRTWFTIAAAFTGMLVIFYHDLGSVSLLGDLLALVTAVGLGITFVIVRHRKAVNMMPAMSMGKFASALAVVPLAAPFDMTATGLGLMLFLGLILLPVSFGLLTLGPRYIPAPEVSLLLLLETVLGPLIVWLAIGEAAAASTIVGGVIVLIALAGNAVLALWARGHARSRQV
jgi:drug/metabolite transporter (DMT)-like permease